MHALKLVLLVCVLAGLYLLFAGQVSMTEAIAGILAVAATLVLVHRHRCSAERSMRFGAPWLRVAGRPLAALLPDAVRVGRVLLRVLWEPARGPLGDLSSQDFRTGGENAADAGRRALVILSTSLAPNGFVVSVPPECDVLALHRLAPAAPLRGREWPE